MAKVLVIFLVLTQLHVLVTSSIVGETLHSTGEPNIAPAPTTRKLGKHRHGTYDMVQAEAPHWPCNDEPEAVVLLNETHLRRPHHGSSVDKSVAGGGVILGGLATTFFVAVFCYIRATRRSKIRPQPTSPITTSTAG